MTSLTTKTVMPYEPKWENRFIVKLPKAFDLKEWVIGATTLPSIRFLGNNQYEWEEIKLTFCDPVGPSTSQRLWDLYRASIDNDDERISVSDDIIALVKDGFDFSIELLDPIGSVVSEWNVFGCQIVSINFGKLTMNEGSLVRPSLIVKPTRAKLLY